MVPSIAALPVSGRIRLFFSDPLWIEAVREAQGTADLLNSLGLRGTLTDTMRPEDIRNVSQLHVLRAWKNPHPDDPQFQAYIQRLRNTGRIDPPMNRPG